jgi:hypothetical protein
MSIPRYELRSVIYAINDEGVFMHDTIMESILGRPLTVNEKVLHRNGNGLDNRTANLALHRNGVRVDLDLTRRSLCLTSERSTATGPNTP